MTDAYCDLCELPLSTCVHGMPKPPPVEEKPKAAPRAARTPRAAASTTTRSTPGLTVRQVGAKRTPQREFRPYILEALVEAGGRAPADLVLGAVEQLMADVLRDGDREPTPAGEVRWRSAARFERKAMLDDGLLLPVVETGVWELSPEGRALATD
ncbi:MAG: hypothetical protein ACXVEC_06245 [Nocardioides sp.]